MERRHYSGTASPTTLSAGIDASTLTIPVTAGVGYPSGTIGPFFIVIDKGLSSEEKIKCVTTVTNTITGAPGGRGADGTAATSHPSGAVVEHVLTADDIDNLNQHAADVADDHEQYAMADGTRFPTTTHDLTGRHTFGAALGTPSTPTAVVNTADAGAGTTPARWDHVHEMGDLWVPYDPAPTITQGVAVTRSEVFSRYHLMADHLTVKCHVQATSNGTSGTAIEVTIPGAANANGIFPMGTAAIFKTSSGLFFPCIAMYQPFGTVKLMDTKTGVYMGLASSGIPQLLAGDNIHYNITYELSS